MLPHDTAYGKKQALPPHMAVWLPQGSSMGFHAHTEHLLGFRHRAAVHAEHRGKAGVRQSQSHTASPCSKHEGGEMADL